MKLTLENQFGVCKFGSLFSTFKLSNLRTFKLFRRRQIPARPAGGRLWRTNLQTFKLPYLYTSIATSGQTKPQSMHPVQASGLTMHAGWYPLGLKFLDKAITSCGHATIHNSQPLHLFSSTSILGIKISPRASFYPKMNLTLEELPSKQIFY
jgi:hypothetical protein